MRLPIALLISALGCGPVLATSVIADAEVALARAHGAEGEKYATYETTLAELYVVKAKEEQGHAHYDDAHELASAAVKFAEAATKKAAERRASDTAPMVPTATVQHPVDVPAGKAATPAKPAAAAPAAAPSTTTPTTTTNATTTAPATPTATPQTTAPQTGAETPRKVIQPQTAPPPDQKPPERKPKAPIDPGNRP